MSNARWRCVVLVAALGLSGPLAPMAAAQMSMQPEIVEAPPPPPGPSIREALEQGYTELSGEDGDANDSR